jgi:CHAD domain-containing protein
MTSETAGSRTATPGRHVEIEHKFRLKTVAAGERYLAMDALGGLAAAARTKTTQLEDRYLDTADGALARSGFAARLRVMPASTIVSIKSTNRRSGDRDPHRREELEGPADRTSGPRDWPPSDARSLILELCGDAPLVELVTIRQLRRRRLFRDTDTTVELSLDEVDVVARSQVVDRFVELEAELVKGDEARLEALADELREDSGLTTATTSKFESALAAVRSHVRRHGPLPEVASDAPDEADEPDQADEAEAPPPVAPVEPAAATNGTARAGPTSDQPAKLMVGKAPGVVADDIVAEAARKVLRFHFARMLAREAGTREGKDAEELHAMRVATRRMRAAWRVFGESFRPDRTKRYRSRLRDIAGRLGAVRDLDVLIEAAQAYRIEQPADEARALRPLFDAWAGYRDDARLLLLRELDGDGYGRFVEDFRVFVQTEGAGIRSVTPVEPHHIRDTMPSRAWAAFEQVRGYEPVLRWADVETLHDLRIAAKWLRYTIEFVREPLEPDATALVARVVALQDHLGLMHDADVAASMSRTFLVERSSSFSGAQAAAIGRYLVSREREVARLRRSVGRPWRGVAGPAFRNRLGRAFARL